MLLHYVHVLLCEYNVGNLLVLEGLKWDCDVGIELKIAKITGVTGYQVWCNRLPEQKKVL